MPAQGGRVNIIAPWWVMEGALVRRSVIVLMGSRFIKTRILSQQAREMLAGKGVGFAELEDAASAVLHLACDKSLNGRPGFPSCRP